MKKKTTKILLLLLLVMSLTGCTKYVQTEDKKVVKNEKTGQNLTLNILCQPEDKTILGLYDANKVEYKKLPKCTEMPVVNKKYDGLWTAIFVQPLAWLIIQLGKLVKNYGVAVILATLLIRGVVYPFTKKSALQSENLKKAKPELDKLEKKYSNKNDQQAMMQKSQEMMIIYKKYEISPLSGCLFAFIQIPLFFAFLEAINRVPVLFEGNLWGFQLGTSPAVAVLNNGEWQYIILMLLVILTTFYSFKLNSGAAMGAEQEKQMKMMRNIMMVTMVIASFTISAGIAIYWITSSAFTIFQNLIVKRNIKNGGAKHA